MHRFAILAFLSVVLSGCFGSNRAVFPPESAVRALEPGRYAVFEIYGPGSKPSEYIEVRQRGSVYEFVNQKGAVNPVTFHPIAGGMHIAQINVEEPGTEKKGYGYALFKISGREVQVHIAECGKQDQAMLKAARVDIRDKYECFIDNVADPAAFFAKLKHNEPPARMVRQ